MQCYTQDVHTLTQSNEENSFSKSSIQKWNKISKLAPQKRLPHSWKMYLNSSSHYGMVSGTTDLGHMVATHRAGSGRLCTLANGQPALGLLGPMSSTVLHGVYSH